MYIAWPGHVFVLVWYLLNVKFDLALNNTLLKAQFPKAIS